MSQTRRLPQLPADSASLPWGEGDRSDLQGHYVTRLRRLLRLRQEHLSDLNQEGVWLLDRSIFATYCDCVAAGGGLAAQEILRSLPSPGEPESTAAAPSRRRRV